MKPTEMLPDGVNEREVNGVTVRKGTIGAFLVSVKQWQEPGLTAEARAVTEQDMRELLPSLRAIGLFDVMQIRDEALRVMLGQD